MPHIAANPSPESYFACLSCSLLFDTYSDALYHNLRHPAHATKMQFELNEHGTDGLEVAAAAMISVVFVADPDSASRVRRKAQGMKLLQDVAGFDFEPEERELLKKMFETPLSPSRMMGW